MATMLKVAKNNHASSIANKLNKNRSKLADQLRRGYEKDLKKLNYTTLVILDTKLK